MQQTIQTFASQPSSSGIPLVCKHTEQLQQAHKKFVVPKHPRIDSQAFGPCGRKFQRQINYCTMQPYTEPFKLIILDIKSWSRVLACEGCSLYVLPVGQLRGPSSHTDVARNAEKFGQLSTQVTALQRVSEHVLASRAHWYPLNRGSQLHDHLLQFTNLHKARQINPSQAMRPFLSPASCGQQGWELAA